MKRGLEYVSIAAHNLVACAYFWQAGELYGNGDGGFWWKVAIGAIWMVLALVWVKILTMGVEIDEMLRGVR